MIARVFPGASYAAHPYRDLAIVELDRAVDGEVLVLSENAQLRPKQPVHILGFPVEPLSLWKVISHPRQLLDRADTSCKRTPRSIQQIPVGRCWMTHVKS